MRVNADSTRSHPRTKGSSNSYTATQKDVRTITSTDRAESVTAPVTTRKTRSIKITDHVNGVIS